MDDYSRTKPIFCDPPTGASTRVILSRILALGDLRAEAIALLPR
jgi:hypothetical protein